MDYRRFIRQAMMLTLTTGLLASCSKENNVGEPEADELIKIIPGAAYTRVDGSASNAGSITGPIDNSMLKDLTFYFTRADYAGRNSWNYSEQAISGTCYEITENQAKVDLTPAQYYLVDGTETTMQGWYPQGTYSIDSRDKVPIVDFTITGKEDIIVSQFLEGNIEDLAINGPAIFTFEHILTQLQFEATAESAIAAEQWGAIEGITLIGETNNCTYYLIDNPEATWGRTTADFNVPLTSNVTIENGNTTPAGIIMISPRTISDRDIITLSIKTTLKEEATEVIIDDELYDKVEFKAGNAYKVTLNFLQGEITVKLTPADWRIVEGEDVNVDLAENQPYAISEMNYIVSRNMFGDAEGWIIRDETWATTPTEESENTIPEILEVAATNLTNDATLDHVGCPEGWRMPSKTELELIQKYKDKLTKPYLGEPISISGTYWSGTKNTDGATYYINMETGEFGTASGNSETHHIRCVRDVEM